MSTEERKEFEKLLQLMGLRPLEEDEFARLNSLMKSEPEWAEEYYEHCYIHSLLEEKNGSLMDRSAIENLVKAEDEPGLKKLENPKEDNKEAKSFPSWIFAVAALLAVAFGVFFLSSSGTKSFMGTLESGINAGLTDENGDHLMPGSEMLQGEYKLKKGLAEIKYGNDVKIIIEGPAKFKFVDKEEIYLSEGKIYAATPPGTKKFTVSTPKAIFNDLGTQFAVEYFDNKDTKLFVFKGKVEAVSQDGSKKVLTAGQGISLGKRNGKLKDIKVREDYFVRQLPDLTIPYQKTLAEFSPVVYLPMEKNQGNKFYNYSTFSPGSVKLSKGSSSKGIVGDAFRCNSGNFLQIGAYPKAIDKISITAWIKMSGPETGVIAQNGNGQGQFSLLLENGKLKAIMLDRHGNPVTVATSKALLPNEWNQIAFVYDGSNVMLYLNSKLVAAKRDSFDGIFTEGLPPMVTVGSDEEDKTFNGYVDEFAIYNKALSSDQIRFLYRLIRAK